MAERKNKIRLDMATGTPQMGEKDLQLLKQRIRGGPPRKESFDSMAWGRTQLRRSEMRQHRTKTDHG